MRTLRFLLRKEFLQIFRDRFMLRMTILMPIIQLLTLSSAATFEVKDLASEMAALRKKGVKFEEYDLPDIKTVRGVATMDGHKGAWFKDPGGNVLALHEGM